MPFIEAKDISLAFEVRQHRRTTLKEYLVKRLFRQSVNPRSTVHALQNVSLRVNEGERVGIIGHNGAGKSTLLRVLGGIYPPTGGTLKVEGRISSLFDIALGFEHEATGWENIYYRGYLQGETPKSIAAKLPGIAEFTELGDFLNMPVRTYSAGMMVRLAFSISTAINPEILLIDEALGVGDSGFQAKARDRMEQMMDRAKLMVVVSHDTESLARLCQRGIWLEHGKIKMEGPMREIVDAYEKEAIENGTRPGGEVTEEDRAERRAKRRAARAARRKSREEAPRPEGPPATAA